MYRIISGEVLSQKKFRPRVLSIIIRWSASQIMDVRSCPAPTFKVVDEMRLDRVGHYPSPAPVRRCAICEKESVILVKNVVKACM